MRWITSKSNAKKKTTYPGALCPAATRFDLYVCQRDFFQLLRSFEFPVERGLLLLGVSSGVLSKKERKVYKMNLSLSCLVTLKEEHMSNDLWPVGRFSSADLEGMKRRTLAHRHLQDS